MNFSKEEIVSKPFSKKWTRGLNEFEVRDFLHILAEQIRHLKQENLMLKKDVKERDELIKDYRDRQHILKESISNAEAWAQKIKQDAEENRQLILEKAQTDSDSLIESARHSLQAVYSDIADLKRLQVQFKTGLKAALQVQLDLLEEDSVFNPAVLNDFSEKEKIQKSTENLSPIESNKEIKSESINSVLQTSKTKTPSVNSQIDSLKQSLQSLNKDFS